MFEESSAWSGLEPEVRDTLATEVRRALAKRSLSGALIYFVSAVVLALSTSYFQEHPAVLVSVSGLCFLLGAARITLAIVVLKQLPACGRVTSVLFSGSIYATVAVWGLFCGLTLQLYRLEWTATFLMLISAALAGGSASSLAPSIGLAERCLLLLMGPAIVSAAALGDKRAWAFAGLTSLYLVFLMCQTKSTWRAFWSTSVAAERERLRGTAERRRAEEERAQLASVIEQAVEEIVFTDDKGIIQYCNRSFENGSGYSRTRWWDEIRNSYSPASMTPSSIAPFGARLKVEESGPGGLSTRRKMGHTTNSTEQSPPFTTRRERSPVMSRPAMTLLRGFNWSRNCDKRRRWRVLESSQAEWHTISITF